MPRAEIDGIGIDYELIGTGRAIAITPGGRFSKDDPGVRELAQALAAGGLRALIWDRPNCGASDLAFRGDSESDLNADILAGLIRKLDLGPTILAGGSAGSRPVGRPLPANCSMNLTCRQDVAESSAVLS